MMGANTHSAQGRAKCWISAAAPAPAAAAAPSAAPLPASGSASRSSVTGLCSTWHDANTNYTAEILHELSRHRWPVQQYSVHSSHGRHNSKAMVDGVDEWMRSGVSPAPGGAPGLRRWWRSSADTGTSGAPAHKQESKRYVPQEVCPDCAGAAWQKLLPVVGSELVVAAWCQDTLA